MNKSAMSDRMNKTICVKARVYCIGYSIWPCGVQVDQKAKELVVDVSVGMQNKMRSNDQEQVMSNCQHDSLE